MSRIIFVELLVLPFIAMIFIECTSAGRVSLTIDSLKNAEYNSEWTSSGKAKLSHGIYKEKVVPNSATELVIMLSDMYAVGDLNGNSKEDAAVVIVSVPGGSGTFYHLAVVVNHNGNPEHIASEFLGDRVKVKSINIKSGEIAVEMIKHSQRDPMVRPTLRVIHTYKLQGSRLNRTNN